jgi:hypothetical protein
MAENTCKSPVVAITKTNSKIVSGVVPDVTASFNYVTTLSMHGNSVLQTGQTLNRIGDI